LKTSSLGNANVDSTTGNVILGNSSLPIAITSLEKLVKGDTHNQVFATYLSSMNSAIGDLSAALIQFNLLLSSKASLLATPVTGPSAFIAAVADSWITFQIDFAASVIDILAAISTLSSSLPTMLSTKTVTQ
jgi:hypothetical protein